MRLDDFYWTITPIGENYSFRWKNCVPFFFLSQCNSNEYFEFIKWLVCMAFKMKMQQRKKKLKDEDAT